MATLQEVRDIQMVMVYKVKMDAMLVDMIDLARESESLHEMKQGFPNMVGETQRLLAKLIEHVLFAFHRNKQGLALPKENVKPMQNSIPHNKMPEMQINQHNQHHNPPALHGTWEQNYNIQYDTSQQLWSNLLEKEQHQQQKIINNTGMHPQPAIHPHAGIHPNVGMLQNGGMHPNYFDAHQQHHHAAVAQMNNIHNPMDSNHYEPSPDHGSYMNEIEVDQLLFGANQNQAPNPPPKKRRKNKEPRKVRTVNRENWKKVAAKRNRYKHNGIIKMPECEHDNKHYKCRTLTEEDVKCFVDRLYATNDKVYQDQFLTRYLLTKEVQNHRLKSQRPLMCSTKYFIDNAIKNRLPICLNAFLTITQVSRFRLNRLAKICFCSDEPPAEKRGGFKLTEKYALKKASVSEFLNKLPYTESNYGREKCQTKYLAPDLTIMKLYKMYKAEKEAAGEVCDVKESYFRYIFTTCFNFGFRSKVQGPGPV